MSARPDVSPNLDSASLSVKQAGGYLGQITEDAAGRAFQLLRIKLGEVLVEGNWLALDSENTVVAVTASATAAWKGFIRYAADATAAALYAWVQIGGTGDALVETGVGLLDQLAPSAATVGVFDVDPTPSPNARAIALEANVSGAAALRLVEITR